MMRQVSDLYGYCTSSSVCKDHHLCVKMSYAEAEAARLATSAGFTGAYKAKDQDCTQDLRSIDVAWVPSETIFGRVELPVEVPELALGQLPDVDASGNGFIPLERLQYGLAEVASDLMCLPQMIMTATGRRDIVSPVGVASARSQESQDVDRRHARDRLQAADHRLRSGTVQAWQRSAVHGQP